MASLPFVSWSRSHIPFLIIKVFKSASVSEKLKMRGQRQGGSIALGASIFSQSLQDCRHGNISEADHRFLARIWATNAISGPDREGEGL